MCTPIRRGKRVELLYPYTPQLENQVLFRGAGSVVTRWWCRVPFEERTNEHVRDRHTLNIVRSGSYVLEDRRGRGVVDTSSVALYNPHEPFMGSHPNGCGDDGWTLLLSPHHVRSLLERCRPSAADSETPSFPAPTGYLTAAARLRHRLLVAEIEQGSESFAVEEALHGLLDELGGSLFIPRRRAVVQPRRQEDPRPYVERAALYMARSFRSTVQLSDVARASYTSMFHLCRLFKAQTGSTLHQYLTRLRLDAALDLLAQPRGDIWRIAREVGFVSHSHFTAAFRRHFGATPSRVRRALASRSERELLRARLPPLVPTPAVDGGRSARSG